ncbi:mCG1027860 [Mus musculus]|nr:mCG1027860 [Mus musculus]
MAPNSQLAWNMSHAMYVLCVMCYRKFKIFVFYILLSFRRAGDTHFLMAFHPLTSYRMV